MARKKTTNQSANNIILYQDENGLTTIKYPDALANQVDIIYIGTLKDQDGNVLHDGEAMYNDFA